MEAKGTTGPVGRHSTGLEYTHSPFGWVITKKTDKGDLLVLARLDVPSTGDPEFSDEEQRANGNLWAAAPGLLAACKEVMALPLAERLGLAGGIYAARLLRNAIEQAEGRAG